MQSGEGSTISPRPSSQNGTTGSDSQRVGYAAGRETNVAQSYKRKEPVDEE